MILDVCCGARLFWFDRQNERVIFMDKRKEKHMLPDKLSKGGRRELIINPDIQADFTALPFIEESFNMVVFDPPHLIRGGNNSWLIKKYGKLAGDWQDELSCGFAECFRVLKSKGTLIFKWSEYDVPLSQILILTSACPLFGNRRSKTHWIVFLKP